MIYLPHLTRPFQASGWLRSISDSTGFRDLIKFNRKGGQKLDPWDSRNSQLPIDRLRLVFIFIDDAEDAFDAFLPAVVIVVDARKVIVVPLKIGDTFMLVLSNSCSQVIAEKEEGMYLIYAPRKVKGRPSL